MSFDSSNRQARYVDVLVRMPGDPVHLPRHARRGAAAADLAGILCSAPVHRDYDGTSDWLATAGFGSVADDLAGATAAATAKSFFDTFRTRRVRQPEDHADRRRTTDQVDLDGHQVALISGNVGYSVPGVPSTFDRVLVIALPLDDGSYAVYFSSRPNDTPKTTLDVLNESINTLSYRLELDRRLSRSAAATLVRVQERTEHDERDQERADARQQLVGPPHRDRPHRGADQRQAPQPTLLGEVAADPVVGGRSAAGLGGHAPILPDV